MKAILFAAVLFLMSVTSAFAGSMATGFDGSMSTRASSANSVMCRYSINLGGCFKPHDDFNVVRPDVFIRLYAHNPRATVVSITYGAVGDQAVAVIEWSN